MSTRTRTEPWLAKALDLSSRLTNPVHHDCHEHEYAVRTPESSPPARPQADDLRSNNIATADFTTPSKKGLGDFSRIWLALGSPLDSSAPTLAPLPAQEPSIFDDLPMKLDYASDGATYVKPAKNGKTVAWQDEARAEDGPTTDTVTDRSPPPSPEIQALTKTQRKKQRRKERQAAEALKSAIVSESEADIVTRRTPAVKASEHKTTPKEAKATDTATATPKPSTNTTASNKDDGAGAGTNQKGVLESGALGSTPVTSQATIAEASAKVAEKLAEIQALAQDTPSKAPKQPKLRNPAPTTPNGLLRPASVTPVTQKKTPAKPKWVIEPRTVRSGEDRHWALLMKLIGDFWDDRKYLVSPMNLTSHNNDPNGIHVFVDAR
jgi:hypothetical protein